MRKIPRPVLISVFLLLLIGSSCNMPAPTRIPVGPIGFNPTSTPLPAETGVVASDTLIAPVIPITGENAVQLLCQFCVNERTHAIFVFPEFALFGVETTATPVTCLTAEVVNGKRVVVCHGAQQTSFNLKICSDPENCLLFPVALQACPLVPNTGIGTPPSTGAPMTPVFLTPLHTLRPTNTDDLLPPTTSTAGTPSPATPTTAPGNTPIPTSILPTVAPTTIVNTPVPTSILPTIAPTSIINTLVPIETDPPATTQPLPTSPPNDNKKDTKTPKPQN